MTALSTGADWYLFDPAAVPALVTAVGEDFSTLYSASVDAGLAIKRIPAAQLWQSVCDSQTEAGSPFILFQDNINRELFPTVVSPGPDVR